MSRVLPVEIGARALGGELVDEWRCGRSAGKYPGAYAAAFLDRAKALFNVEPVLHVCAGGVDEDLSVDVWHDRARPRPDGVRGVNPSIVADGRRLPFKPRSFGLVLLDPPWSREWTRTLYALDEDDYPDPCDLLAEAVEVVVPGGFVGISHLHVPPTPRGTRRVARIRVIAGTVTKGRIRRFTVFQRALEPNGSTDIPPAREPVHRSRDARTGQRRRVRPTSAEPVHLQRLDTFGGIS